MPRLPVPLLLLGLPALLAVACGDKDDGETPYVPPTDDTGVPDDECDMSVDADCDGVNDEDDCDPNDGLVYPGATELPYDGKDNDCAGDGDLTDVDGDGYDGVGGGGDDCNDSNPTIYPGAEDICYDGIDQDCDGFPASPDDDTTDCDGDGHVGIGTEATDCDDTDASVNPDATEVWYDGVDQDCTGPYSSDYDADGDGENHWDYEVDGEQGTDCDDTDDSVYAEAGEIWDGQDNNCDDDVDTVGIFDADHDWFANTSSNDYRFGYQALEMQDYDADGDVDFGVGGPLSGADGVAAGWFQVFDLSDGSGGTPADYAASKLYNSNDGAWFGWDADMLDDYDGDGWNEVIVGSPLHNSGTGSAFVFAGEDIAAGTGVAQGGAPVQLSGPTYVGFGVEHIGDVNGDGYGEVAAATTDYLISLGYSIPMEVGVWDIKSAWDAGGDDLVSTDAEAIISSSSGRTGGEMLGGEDLDGDGAADLVLAINVDAGGALIYVPATDMSGGATLDTASYEKLAGNAGAMAGASLAFIGDVDEDGVVDVAVGAPGANGAAGADSQAGEVYLVSGADMGTSGGFNSVAFATIDGVESSGQLQLVTEQGADTDGDGFDDILVASVGMFASGHTPSAYLVPSTAYLEGGAMSVTDVATATFTSRTADDWFGVSGLMFDVDTDGDVDILIGGPNNNGVGMATMYLNHSFE